VGDSRGWMELSERSAPSVCRSFFPARKNILQRLKEYPRYREQHILPFAIREFDAKRMGRRDIRPH
jgi:hypothetical protein